MPRLAVGWRWLAFLWLAGLAGPGACAAAQGSQFSQLPQPAGELRIDQWLTRLHDAAHAHSYTGSFVISSSAGDMASGRVWHAQEGGRLVEKIEFLSGEPRVTLRRGDQLVTLLPSQRLARLEQRRAPQIFTDLVNAHDASPALVDLYGARRTGSDRVAGRETDVVVVVARDALRYGYRIWSDRRSGLVVKLQTLGPKGEVLEQAAFSDLQLDSPVHAPAIVRAMTPPEGWQVERVVSERTTAAAEGWTLRPGAAGFNAMPCWRRTVPGREGFLQCGFTDGLASVSLFIEPYDPRRQGGDGTMAAGATQTLTRRVQDHWLTVVGEVPLATLRSFAKGLERRP